MPALSDLVNECWHLNDIIKKLIRGYNEPEPSCDYYVTGAVLYTASTDSVSSGVWYVSTDAEVDDSVLYLCLDAPEPSCDYSVLSRVLYTPNTDHVSGTILYIESDASVDAGTLYLCAD